MRMITDDGCGEDVFTLPDDRDDDARPPGSWLDDPSYDLAVVPVVGA